jgi:hypothetical protein
VSSKKSTDSTSSQNSTQTTTPNVPTWFSQPTQQLAGQVSGLLGQSSSYTPGISNLQQQATTGASNLSVSPNYQTASDALNGISPVGNVTGQSVLDNLSSYYNPFESQITNPVMADYDAQAAQTQAQQQAQAAQGGAFGGSRYGVQQAQTTSDLARGRAATEGGLLQNMYTQAAGMSEADTARRQQADLANQQTGLQNNAQAMQRAMDLATIGQQQGADTRANVGMESDIGGIQTNAENAIKQFPLSYDQQMESMLSGLNPQLFTGSTNTGQSTSTSHSTETQDPGLLGALGTAAQIGSLFVPGGGALSMFSKLGGAGGMLQAGRTAFNPAIPGS